MALVLLTIEEAFSSHWELVSADKWNPQDMDFFTNLLPFEQNCSGQILYLFEFA